MTDGDAADRSRCWRRCADRRFPRLRRSPRRGPAPHPGRVWRWDRHLPPPARMPATVRIEERRDACEGVRHGRTGQQHHAVGRGHFFGIRRHQAEAGRDREKAWSLRPPEKNGQMRGTRPFQTGQIADLRPPIRTGRQGYPRLRAYHGEPEGAAIPVEAGISHAGLFCGMAPAGGHQLYFVRRLFWSSAAMRPG